MLSVISYTPETTIAALAAMIIGVVLSGSNATTWTQAETALHAAEAARAELIERMDMRVVGEQKPTVHRGWLWPTPPPAALRPPTPLSPRRI